MSFDGSRGPPRIEGMVSLKVDNITYRTTVEQLKKLFEKYGELGDVYVPRDRYTHESRGFAFIRYFERKDAEDAMDNLNGYYFDGREIRVQMAKYGRPDNSYKPRRGSYNRSSGSYGGYGGGRRRSKSRSPRRRSRSRSPRRRRSRSRSPKRSRSRSYSPPRSRSRSKSRSPKRSPRRNRSTSRSRSKSPHGSPARSRSKSPIRSGSRSRSRSHSRSRSRSPPRGEGSPRRGGEDGGRGSGAESP